MRSVPKVPTPQSSATARPRSERAVDAACETERGEGKAGSGQRAGQQRRAPAEQEHQRRQGQPGDQHAERRAGLADREDQVEVAPADDAGHHMRARRRHRPITEADDQPRDHEGDEVERHHREQPGGGEGHRQRAAPRRTEPREEAFARERRRHRAGIHRERIEPGQPGEQPGAAGEFGHHHRDRGAERRDQNLVQQRAADDAVRLDAGRFGHATTDTSLRPAAVPAPAAWRLAA